MSLFLLYFDGGPLHLLEGNRGSIFFEERWFSVTSGGRLLASRVLSICYNWSSDPFRFSFDPDLHPELLELISRRLEAGKVPHLFFHWFDGNESVLEVKRGAEISVLDAHDLFESLHRTPNDELIRITSIANPIHVPIPELIARRLEAFELPLFDGILFGDGTIALMECRVAPESPDARPDVRPLVRSTLDSLLEHNPNRWTSVVPVASCRCDAEGLTLICGEGSTETDGFVAVRGIEDGALRWAAFFQSSGPFREIFLENDSVVAITDHGHRWRFPLERPEQGLVVDPAAPNEEGVIP